MLKQLLMIAARQFLSRRRSGPGPRRAPGASPSGFKQRAAQEAMRWVMNRFMKR